MAYRLQEISPVAGAKCIIVFTESLHRIHTILTQNTHNQVIVI